MQFDGLGPRWAAACDVPDLELLPSRYPEVKTLQFRAALELGVQHFTLASVAQLRRWGLPLPLERWAPQFDQAASWLNRFGSERGGMLGQERVTGAGKAMDDGSAAWTANLTAMPMTTTGPGDSLHGSDSGGK